MRPNKSHAAGIIIGTFGLLAVCFTGQFPPFTNPNELSRLETVFAFVERGTFEIDRVIPVLGDHEDKAASGGHLYSNKAPGLALAAIPVYRLLRAFFPPPHSASDAIFVWLRILVVSSLCTVGLARFHGRLLEADNSSASLVAVAVAFGTPYLYYARSFLSHAWCASLIFLSWDLLRIAGQRPSHRRVDSLALWAGLLAGWASISEYPVALLGLLLGIHAAAGPSLRRFLLFVLGACFPVALLLLYDKACFGSALVLSSSREALPQYASLARQGLFGFEAPRLSVALAYLFHPARGFLLFSPFLLWAAAGLLRWWRKGVERREATFALGATVVFFVALCGYPNWHGGWALGDRYLLPVALFAALAIPYAVGSPASRGFFAAAAIFSVSVHALAAATWPHFPLNVPWPPGNGSLWFLQRGWIAPGPLPGGLRLMVALVGPAAAVLVALSDFSADRRRRAIPFAVALAVFGITLARPPVLSYGGRLWRAAVFGRFSGRDPDRVELKHVIEEASTPSERKRASDAWRLYGK